MLIVLLGYISCLMMLSDVMTAFLIRRFLVAAIGCALIGLIITPFWKISLHMISMGGLLALLCALQTAGLGQLYPLLLIFILLTGLLGSARLWFGSHNLAQVAAGFVTGFTVALLLIIFV